MILTTHLLKKHKLFLVICASLILVCLQSDTVHFEAREKKHDLTTVQFINSCAPAEIVELQDISISRGSNWKMVHAYHCHGNRNVIATINNVGIQDADLHISHALAITYLEYIQKATGLTCRNNIKPIKHEVIIAGEEKVLVAPYILDCDDFE